MRIGKPVLVGSVMALVCAALVVGCSDDERLCYGADVTYELGESFDQGCRSCTCNDDASITCTATAACAAGCEDADGGARDLGAFWPAGDGCNVCQCATAGKVECTENSCGVPCTYGGLQKAPGESFPSVDGCNTCTCESDGTVSCTAQACACEPTDEWWRSYVAMTPAECAAIDYTCPSNTTAFENSCGCGCEQNSDCAQQYDCAPPSMCDTAKILSDCPFSEILE